MSDSAGRSVYERKYVFTFFSEGADLLAALDRSKTELRTKAGSTLFIVITLMGIIFLITGVWQIRRIKLTKSIIFLLETCEDILMSRTKDDKDKNYTLSFKASNLELNALHLAFNQVVKIINIIGNT